MGQAVNAVTGIAGSATSMLGGLTKGLTPEQARTQQISGQMNQLGQSAQDILNERKKDIADRDFRANITGAELDNARSQFGNAIGMAQSAALGGAPSVAQNQLQTATDKNISQLAAQAAAQRGAMNPALAQRNIANAAANMQAATNQNAATLRAQEITDARGQFLQGTSAQAQQEGSLAANQAQLDQQAQIQKQQMLNSIAGQNINSLQNFNANGLLSDAGAYNQAAMANQQQQAAVTGGLLSGAGGLGAALITKSDKTEKKNIKAADVDVQKFLSALKASKYEYKDESNGKGEFVSPMAQELEKTPLGKSMVQDTAEGKMVDYGRGFGTMLAAQASLNSRLEDLEKALAKKKGAK